MKTRYKVLIAAVIIILFLYSLFAAFKSRQPSVSQSGNSLSLPTKSGDTLKVYDIRQNPVLVTGDTTVVAQTESYSIVFFAKDQSILITLLSQPVQRSRDQAEQALLDKLKISFTEACQLKVSLSIPASVDEQLAGTDYGLSFCPNGQHF